MITTAGSTRLLVMDDTRQKFSPLPISHWLRFALAFADSTRLLRLLRRAQPNTEELANSIRNYLHDGSGDLPASVKAVDERVSLQALRHPKTVQRCQQALEWQSQSSDHHLLGLDSPHYPELLLATDDAPPVLYARGDLRALDYPLLAVVGSRKATHPAIKHTERLCHELADMGIGIVSGLAHGIDKAAHEAALSARHDNPFAGPTVALSATPINRIYPSRHTGLADRMVARQGLILSEYPLGSVTKPWHFPRRNRLISGVSLGVLIVEAALPSGTLTTAEHAINQGREVMAVPGSVSNPQSRGCHLLIRNGAALVESARDVVEELMPALSRARREKGLEISQPACGLRTTMTSYEFIPRPQDPPPVPALAAPASESASQTGIVSAVRVARRSTRSTAAKAYLSSHPAAPSIELSGAKTTTSPQQSLALEPSSGSVSSAEQRILDTLHASPATLDELVAYTSLAVPELAATLGTLETRSLVIMISGGRYAPNPAVSASEKLPEFIDKA